MDMSDSILLWTLLPYGALSLGLGFLWFKRERLRRMNKSKLLGYVIVGYAFLTSGGLIGIVFAPLTWEYQLTGILWLLLLIAGIGLVLGKQWSRVLTLAVSAAMLIRMVIVAGDQIETDVSLLWRVAIIAEAVLPPLALLVAATLVKIPQPLDKMLPPPNSAAHPREQPWTRRRAPRDIAYAAFIVLGLIALFEAYFFFGVAGDNEDSFYALLSFGIIIWGLPFLIAVLLGPCLSIFLWRDYRLAILLAASVAELAGLVYSPHNFWAWILVPYGALSLGFGLLWFGRDRRSFGGAEP